MMDGTIKNKENDTCAFLESIVRLCGPGANCVVIKKATAATRAKLTILDTDPSYAVRES